MLTNRQLFFQHLAQTSDAPLALEIKKAEGIYLYDVNGKSYMDLISGISVSGIGHRHPAVVAAIKEQTDKYLHLMVYGEYIQSPQVQLAHALVKLLPGDLDAVYLVNSGSEAVEGAMKLAKRATGRTEFISFKNAYHGSTQGSLSLMGDESFKQAFRPLLPDVKILNYNVINELKEITEKTAAVIIEPVQGEAGAVVPSAGYLAAVKKRCEEVGALLVMDEIQTGFGRTGKMFGSNWEEIVPDIICMAKGLGGGMPIGAFAANQKIMRLLTHDPVLGHITTFGGHPVSAAAALAFLQVLESEQLVAGVAQKEKLFRELLVHEKIRSIQGKGLLLALEFASFEENKAIIDRAIRKGVITDWFLFNANSMRIAPPLTITEEEIRAACNIILSCI